MQEFRASTREFHRLFWRWHRKTTCLKRESPLTNSSAILCMKLTNLFSLFFEVLQNFRNSASIFFVLDLTSGVSELANFSTTVIHTVTQHHIYKLFDPRTASRVIHSAPLTGDISKLYSTVHATFLSLLCSGLELPYNANIQTKLQSLVREETQAQNNTNGDNDFLVHISWLTMTVVQLGLTNFNT